MKKIIIAIDGFSACGKSSTAKATAKTLNYSYIDTGAMYRAVTLYFLDNHIELTNPKSVSKALSNIDISFHFNEKTGVNDTYLNGLNVENEIRKMEVAQYVSEVSADKTVRDAMVAQQRKMGKAKGVVMDGRDIGTAVFPDAHLKVFMTADVDVRAERRQKELFDRDQLVDLSEVKDNLISRDKQDTSREENPLRQADDAVVVDTTHMFFEEQVDEIVQLATAKMVGE
ncbi:MAG: (d)CMP kinase [Reichenbachiella sp.]